MVIHMPVSSFSVAGVYRLLAHKCSSPVVRCSHVIDRDILNMFILVSVVNMIALASSTVALGILRKKAWRRTCMSPHSAFLSGVPSLKAELCRCSFSVTRLNLVLTCSAVSVAAASLSRSFSRAWMGFGLCFWLLFDIPNRCELASHDVAIHSWSLCIKFGSFHGS